jgi:hypothetical protein
VESTTHTSSVHRLVSRASIPISQLIVAARLRSRLLYPGCCGRYGNKWCRCAVVNRSQRDSLVNPSRACITASVTSSASEICGLNPISGRHGARCGAICNRSSIVTYSAVARVSRSASTRASGFDVGCETPILDTLRVSTDHDTPNLHALE